MPSKHTTTKKKSHKSAFEKETHERNCKALIAAIEFLMDKYQYTKFDFNEHRFYSNTFDAFLDSEARRKAGQKPRPVKHKTVSKNLGIVLRMLRDLREELKEDSDMADDEHFAAAAQKYKECRDFFDEIVFLAHDY